MAAVHEAFEVFHLGIVRLQVRSAAIALSAPTSKIAPRIAAKPDQNASHEVHSRSAVPAFLGTDRTATWRATATSSLSRAALQK